MNQLNAYMALEIMHDSIERAERDRRARLSREQPPAGGARTPSGTHRLRRAFAVQRRAPATPR